MASCVNNSLFIGPMIVGEARVVVEEDAITLCDLPGDPQVSCPTDAEQRDVSPRITEHREAQDSAPMQMVYSDGPATIASLVEDIPYTPEKQIATGIVPIQGACEPTTCSVIGGASPLFKESTAPQLNPMQIAESGDVMQIIGESETQTEAPPAEGVSCEEASVPPADTMQIAASGKPASSFEEIVANVQPPLAASVVCDGPTELQAKSMQIAVSEVAMQIVEERVSHVEAPSAESVTCARPQATTGQSLPVLDKVRYSAESASIVAPVQDNPNLSQESFLREIDEIHQNALASSPIPKPRVRVDKATTNYHEMATQTGPREIPDPPVSLSEYTSQMEYVDQTLTNHERRLRANDVWREKEQRNVDSIDADLYTMIIEIRESHESLIVDYNDLKKVVSDLLMVSPNFENLVAVSENSRPQPSAVAEGQQRSERDESVVEMRSAPSTAKSGPVQARPPASIPRTFETVKDSAQDKTSFSLPRASGLAQGINPPSTSNTVAPPYSRQKAPEIDQGAVAPEWHTACREKV